MSNTEKANLARIRDNQRRSRARRKGYLQDLEGKFRNCELLGVEASSEIQAAARRVAEENKRLRLLLRSRGVPESEINNYVGKSTDNPRFLSEPTTLDSLLSARRQCNGEKPGCSPVLSESPSSSISWKPVSTSARSTSKSDACRPHCLTPSSNMSAAPLAQQYPQAAVLFDVNDFSQTNSECHQPAPTETWSGPSNYELAEEIDSDPNTSSCTFATNLIRDINTGVSAEQLKEELGCAPNTECKIDNSTLFSVMDRYSG
ncbi:MAG: hypothetical protein M1830_005092 [Pleopsidium flavum]|nr:MAG: hypothetical protein M1830_005092 [Pleopsidium flavum]